MQRVIEGDSYKHKGLRVDLCNLLRQRGITDEAVLAAIGRVPRHLFMDRGLDALAYEDQALPIECGQTISQPRTVAFQTQLLAVRKDMKVLEIGTGSGYQTAVLCELGARVFSVERQKGLYDVAKARLAKMHYQAKCFLGDGYQGLAQMDYGPYDRILVTCGAPDAPEPASFSVTAPMPADPVLETRTEDGRTIVSAGELTVTAGESGVTIRCGDERLTHVHGFSLTPYEIRRQTGGDVTFRETVDGLRASREGGGEEFVRQSNHGTVTFDFTEDETLFGLGSHEEGFPNLRG